MSLDALYYSVILYSFKEEYALRPVLCTLFSFLHSAVPIKGYKVQDTSFRRPRFSESSVLSGGRKARSSFMIIMHSELGIGTAFL